MSRTMKNVAIILLIVELIGCLFAASYYFYDFNWLVFIVGGIVSFIGFLLFYSVGVILEHLESIRSALSMQDTQTLDGKPRIQQSKNIVIKQLKQAKWISISDHQPQS